MNQFEVYGWYEVDNVRRDFAIPFQIRMASITDEVTHYAREVVLRAVGNGSSLITSIHQVTRR